MKVIILSDYFDEKAEAYLKGFCKSNYNKSGLFYQRNLFSGFVKVVGEENVKMFCCPTCGTFPNETKLFWSPEFKSDKESIEYIGFINILYLRNIFRYIGLKRHLRRYLKTISKEEQVIVLTIQMHHPFMKAFRFIKKQFPNAKSCINIWDYPNFVDFRNNNALKKALRNFNYNRTMRLLKDYDLCFYLSKGMEELNIYKNQYIVHEGILSNDQLQNYDRIKRVIRKDDKFHVAFTGRLTRAEGVLDLISAICAIGDDSIVLEIAGGGDVETDVVKASQENSNIVFHGLLTREKVVEMQCRADLFVLPRLPEDYTKYSFPSKLCEYIVAKKPILTRPLPCFDSYLLSRFFIFSDENNDYLTMHLKNAIKEARNYKGTIDYDEFIKKNMNDNIANEIICKLLKQHNAKTHI